MPTPAQARIGIDLVQIEAVARSIAEFGSSFTDRLFADGELRDSTVDGGLDAGALAARFAAKEATIKAFDLSESGIGWRQIEVTDWDGVGGRVRLHGRAAACAAPAGAYEIAVTLSRSGGLACAIVVALPADAARGAAQARGPQEPMPLRALAHGAGSRNEQRP